MRRLASRFLGGPLQPVLIVCFSLVAALTVGLSAAVTLRVITDYLDTAMSNRVARDMALASAFYQIKLDEVEALARYLAQDGQINQDFGRALTGDLAAEESLQKAIGHRLDLPALGSTHLVAVIAGDGEIVAGQSLLPEETIAILSASADWRAMPIVADALVGGRALAATEVVPAALLADAGLAGQAAIALIDTPLAAPQPFDLREGTAGLALVAVHPLADADGAVLAAYLFNNDFTLVDRIKEVAEVDTATVFFGDLRVSTNVTTEAGERAVGTRVSQEVFDVVLRQEQDYVGRAFVVNDWFITRYKPLRDHRRQVVGSLYVGARESRFQALSNEFRDRVSLIAVVSVALAGIVAVPIARLVTRPITRLVEANRHLAEGDMQVRVRAEGGGELAQLGRSFNDMAETLDQTQQALLHKERLASMGQLAAGVAHEINNPLATVLLFAEALQRETAEGDPHREDLALIINETIRCKTIVADLLNFARQQEVLAQETNLNALLDRVIALAEPQPRFAKVAFDRRYDPDLPPIQADPAQLEQVFLNLVNNAAEAMPEGGTITLTTQAVGGRDVRVEVSDTGCGIPAENVPKLFTPFFTTKALGKGTGLGLSIVYGIVKMHQGQIAVRSQPGEGTTFTVTLPLWLVKGQAGSGLIGGIAAF